MALIGLWGDGLRLQQLIARPGMQHLLSRACWDADDVRLCGGASGRPGQDAGR